MNMGCDFLIEDSFEDGCSICLEPFTSLDPASVTKCKHEYHLHCILEWSQRRIECPVCLQHLVLNDPASQEMLVAAERENKFRANRANQKNENSPSAREPDLERRMMRRVAAAVTSARTITRRRRPSTPAASPSRILPSAPITSSSNVTRVVPTYCFSSVTPADVQIDSRQSPSNRRGRSLKFKLSTASVRYRESLSKGTRSLKEKIISRNDSVKELSKGVQREMSAGIAGIARLISRKRGGVCAVPSSTGAAGTSHSRREARSVEDDSIVESLLLTEGGIMSSNHAIATTSHAQPQER
ncbi:hypothetical protein C2S53_018853 [Perilla frutescens var. hirtella]|uniref:RING-type E3 ubiquitin transferase n=1 Tax=Perilla frutescens var. hirtella TaxID=608512 RepID=A0AAD4IU93_PERFH|nr:hypothetical protein C2S53_018853 [Perilla frutescens var. hirtella]